MKIVKPILADQVTIIQGLSKRVTIPKKGLKLQDNVAEEIVRKNSSQLYLTDVDEEIKKPKKAITKKEKVEEPKEEKVEEPKKEEPKEEKVEESKKEEPKKEKVEEPKKEEVKEDEILIEVPKKKKNRKTKKSTKKSKK